MPRSGQRGARRAGAEDLQGVADVDEAVLGGDPVRPGLHRRAVDLDGAAAGPAHQVVVVALAAPAVEVLAAGRPHDVDLAGVGQALQGAVDRGQADPLAALAQHRVQLLGAVEALDLGRAARSTARALPGVADDCACRASSLDARHAPPGRG